MSGDEDYHIRQRAYDFWAEAGRPDRRHLEFWTAAEREAQVEKVKSKVAEPAPEAGSLDENLAGTFPANDPLAETSPGGPRFD